MKRNVILLAALSAAALVLAYGCASYDSLLGGADAGRQAAADASAAATQARADLEALLADPTITDEQREAGAQALAAVSKTESVLSGVTATIEAASGVIDEQGNVNQDAINAIGQSVAQVAPAAVAPWIPIATLIGGPLVGFVANEIRRRRDVAAKDAVIDEQVAIAIEAERDMVSLVRAIEKSKRRNPETAKPFFEAAGSTIEANLSDSAKRRVDQVRTLEKVGTAS
ncbi:MAG: hypothetical protein AAFR96_09320 [Planctomycetota bacterium]